MPTLRFNHDIDADQIAALIMGVLLGYIFVVLAIDLATVYIQARMIIDHLATRIADAETPCQFRQGVEVEPDAPTSLRRASSLPSEQRP